MGTRKKDNTWAWVLGAIAVAGLAISASANNNSILDEFDKVVGALNKSSLGKGWGALAIEVLKYEMRSMLPPPLMMLLEFVYEAEQHSRRQQRPLTGAQKKQHATQLRARSGR